MFKIFDNSRVLAYPSGVRTLGLNRQNIRVAVNGSLIPLEPITNQFLYFLPTDLNSCKLGTYKIPPVSQLDL